MTAHGPAGLAVGEEVAEARPWEAGSRAGPSAPRRSWRVSTGWSRRWGGARPLLSATWPAVIASPPASAASTAAFVPPGAVRRGERAAGWRRSPGAARLSSRRLDLAVAWARLRAGAAGEACVRAPTRSAGQARRAPCAAGRPRRRAGQGDAGSVHAGGRSRRSHPQSRSLAAIVAPALRFVCTRSAITRRVVSGAVSLGVTSRARSTLSRRPSPQPTAALRT